jgi:hypothetical protein
MSRLGNYTRVALPTIGRIADYIIATHVRDRNARYVLVFMCCGWATTEVVLAAALQARGLRIGREVYFDRTVGKECLDLLLARQDEVQRTHEVVLVTHIQALHDACGQEDTPLLLFGVNAGFSYMSPNAGLYAHPRDYQLFFDLCERWSASGKLSNRKWFNILEWETVNKNLPLVPFCDRVCVYECAWSSLAAEQVARWHFVLGAPINQV